MKTGFILMNFFVYVIFVTCLVKNCYGDNVKKSIDDNRDGDTGESSYESKDESLDIPMENDTPNITCTRRQNSLMHEIRNAAAQQFPFMAAILSQQNEYLCSGSVVSNGMVLTTAACTQQPVSHVLLNTITDKTDEPTVSLHVMKTERFPTYAAVEGTKDVGIIYTARHNNSIATKLKLSNYSNPRLLSEVRALGFGLNADIGQVRDLQYVGLEVRYAIEVSENVKAYFDCIETKVNTCYKDTGGPVVFNQELVGVVTKGQPECTKEMTAMYALNKRMIDFLPTYVFKSWLDEKISRNEDREPLALAAYPGKKDSRSGRRHPQYQSWSSPKRGNSGTSGTSNTHLIGILILGLPGILGTFVL